MAKLINIAADADALRLDGHHYQAFIGILMGGQAGGRFQMAVALNMKNTQGKKEEDLVHLSSRNAPRHLLILNQSKLNLATLSLPSLSLSLPL